MNRLYKMAGGTLKKDWGDTTRHAEGYALGEGERKAKERETERDTHTEREARMREDGKRFGCVGS